MRNAVNDTFIPLTNISENNAILTNFPKIKKEQIISDIILQQKKIFTKIQQIMKLHKVTQDFNKIIMTVNRSK